MLLNSYLLIQFLLIDLLLASANKHRFENFLCHHNADGFERQEFSPDFDLQPIFIEKKDTVKNLEKSQFMI